MGWHQRREAGGSRTGTDREGAQTRSAPARSRERGERAGSPAGGPVWGGGREHAWGDTWGGEAQSKDFQRQEGDTEGLVHWAVGI